MSKIVEQLKDEAVNVAIERSPSGLSTRDVSSSVIWQAAAHIERLEAALTEFMDATASAALPSAVDPVFGAMVEALGSQVGYGALISSASASWREDLARAGYPTGGEFVVGPCMATLTSVRAKSRAALTRSET